MRDTFCPTCGNLYPDKEPGQECPFCGGEIKRGTHWGAAAARTEAERKRREREEEDRG